MPPRGAAAWPLHTGAPRHAACGARCSHVPCDVDVPGAVTSAHSGAHKTSGDTNSYERRTSKLSPPVSLCHKHNEARIRKLCVATGSMGGREGQISVAGARLYITSHSRPRSSVLSHTDLRRRDVRVPKAHGSTETSSRQVCLRPSLCIGRKTTGAPALEVASLRTALQRDPPAKSAAGFRAAPSPRVEYQSRQMPHRERRWAAEEVAAAARSVIARMDCPFLCPRPSCHAVHACLFLHPYPFRSWTCLPYRHQADRRERPRALAWPQNHRSLPEGLSCPRFG